MAKAKKLPSGQWRVLAYARGQYKSFTDTTARKAELAAMAWQEHQRDIQRDASNMTVDEAADAYILAKDNILSPATIRGYRTIQKNYLSTIKNTKLSKLDKNTVQSFVNALASQYSPKTVKNVYGFVTALLATFSYVDFQGKITLPQQKKSIKRALSQSEIAILLNYVRGKEIELPIMLGLWLGMRRSEICAITWSDVNLKEKTVSVNKAVVPNENEDYVVKLPKTVDSTRVLRLPDYICNILSTMPQQSPDECVVKIEPDCLSQRFIRLANRLGLKGYTFHDLRRSMATVGMSLNITDKVLMARGGWNNPKTMKEIYQVVLSDDVSAADKMFDLFFNNIISNDTTQNTTRE